jgi:hypothetical protein
LDEKRGCSSESATASPVKKVLRRSTQAQTIRVEKVGIEWTLMEEAALYGLPEYGQFRLHSGAENLIGDEATELPLR